MPELQAIARYNTEARRASREGRLDQALLSLAMALRLAREIGRPLLEAYSKHHMGLVYAQAGRSDEAELCFRMALRMTDADAPASAREALRRKLRRSMGSPSALVH
ncbi:hypothetical protein M7784_09755 [Desulfovibrio aminophilus]|nr:hypothetical protein [Desulfovibrio aminophilus]MCM0755527.1 hypothetical protein [Desulfovibrio aminophilus]